MERAAAREPGADDPALAAERRVAALCRGYVGFAVDQPGLYRAAFCAPRPAAPDEPAQERQAPDPELRAFTLIREALEALARTGTPGSACGPPPAPPRGRPFTDCHFCCSKARFAACPPSAGTPSSTPPSPWSSPVHAPPEPSGKPNSLAVQAG